MEWQLILILVMAIPVIVITVLFVRCMNTEGIHLTSKGKKAKKVAGEKVRDPEVHITNKPYENWSISLVDTGERWPRTKTQYSWIDLAKVIFWRV